MDEELKCLIALTMAHRMGYAAQHQLLNALGSARAVFEHRHDVADVLPDATPALRTNIAEMERHLSAAEQEIEWASQKGVQCIACNDPRYPVRLRSCADAPLVLYFFGKGELNRLHMVSMVGTRQCTEYGKELCRRFTSELAELVPGTLVVSGLAYGVDIHSHRAAMAAGLPTVAVLAHGLEQVYPRLHQQTALEMTEEGGLLTEYVHGSVIDKGNFVARNRIVAGMTEATVVVESAAKGGSLITARLANEYGRSVCAFPGRVSDASSEGCHLLIRKGEAHLITSASDFVQQMGWQAEATLRKQPVQRQLFLQLTPEEQRIADALAASDGRTLGELVALTSLPASQLASLLMQMEMKGVLKMMVGGMYRLLG